MTLTVKQLARALRAFSGALWPSDEGLVFRYVLAESIVAAADALEADDEPSNDPGNWRHSISEAIYRNLPPAEPAVASRVVSTGPPHCADAATRGEGGRGVEMSDEELARALSQAFVEIDDWESEYTDYPNHWLRVALRARELLAPELPSEEELTRVLRGSADMFDRCPAGGTVFDFQARAALAYLRERNRG